MAGASLSHPSAHRGVHFPDHQIGDRLRDPNGDLRRTCRIRGRHRGPHVTSRTLRRDFLQIARDFQKTWLLITHRIDDALEMADRALVLSAPAKVVLEVRISDAARSNPGEIADLHAQIASAMGGESHDAQ
jgi:hypothetical protein